MRAAARLALPALAVLAGLVLALGPALLRLPDVPWFLGEIIAVLGCLWAWLAWRGNRTPGRLAVAGVATLLTGGHLFWLASLSAYEPPVQALALGAKPDVSAVRVRDGAPFRLGEQRGRGVLLVVFRGAW